MINKKHMVAKNLLEKFEVKTNADGKEIIICYGHKDLKNFIQKVHGELLPDNFIYQTIYNCIESVANGSTTLFDVFEDMTPEYDIYDLTEWSVSNPLRINRVNSVLAKCQGKNYVELLNSAQCGEIGVICLQTFDYLEGLSN